MSDPNLAPWNGPERRSAPLHIINYVDGRLREHAERIESVLTGHIKDEDDKIQAIHDRLDANDKASEARHKLLSDQLTLHLTKQSQVEDAFLRTEQGHPDYHGHREHHSLSQRAAKWRSDLRNNTAAKLFEYTVIGFLIWAALHLWPVLLKGPTP